MTAMYVMGLIANVGACILHAFLLRKAWWSPAAGAVLQVAWLAYAILGWPNTGPMLITAVWFMAWYVASIRKWYRERTD